MGKEGNCIRCYNFMSKVFVVLSDLSERSSSYSFERNVWLLKTKNQKCNNVFLHELISQCF